MSLILRKFAVQALDNRWVVLKGDDSYELEYEKSLRSVFDTEEDIRKLLVKWGFPGDYDIITVFVKY